MSDVKRNKGKEGDEVAGTGGVGASFSNVIRKNVPDRMMF